MNRVSTVSLNKKFNIYSGKIQRVAVKILRILNKDGVETEVYLIGNRKMRFLNKKFRGKDKTTTVLSFEEPRNFIYPPLAGRSNHKKIGEIYLNAELHGTDAELCGNSSRKSALSCRLSVINCQLLAHGLLHLLGYDHQKKSDRIKMEKKEQYILARL